MCTPSSYDSTALAREGVVLVTINYHVGNLDYFLHLAPVPSKEAKKVLDEYFARRMVQE